MRRMPAATASDVEAHRGGQRGQRGAGQRGVQAELATQRGVLAKEAQRERRIGHRRGDAAAAVGRRPGHGPGASRTDLQMAAGIEPGDGSAARPDGVDVERRQRHRQPLETRLAGEHGRAIHDDGRVQAGAAHIQGDDVGDAHLAGECGRADDATGRTRQHQVDRSVLGGLHGHGAPTRAGHQEVTPEATLLERALQPRQVGPHHGLDVGIEDRRAGSLVLPVLAQQSMREGHVAVGQLAGQDGADLELVRRVRVAVQQAHRYRGHAGGTQRCRDRGDRGAIQGRQHRAIEGHPARHLEDQVARHQRGRLAVAQVVHRLAIGPAELEDIAEALRGDDGHAGARACQQCVERERRAMHEVRHVYGRDADLGERIEDTGGRVGGRRLDLVHAQDPGRGVDGHHVRERPANVDRDADSGRGSAVRRGLFAHLWSPSIVPTGIVPNAARRRQEGRRLALAAADHIVRSFQATSRRPLTGNPWRRTLAT